MSQPDIPGLEAATRYSKLMVLGKPGAGKTTFLKFLAIQCNQGNFQPQCIPIFIELKAFARNANDEYNFSLLKYITEQLCIYEISPQQIEKLLYQGKFLILLDGLDEIKDTNAYEVQSEINNFIGIFYKNKFFISCRVAAHQYKFQGFRDIEIADFNEEQIAQFVNKWFVAVAGKSPEKTLPKSNELLEEFYWEGNEPILELAVTPILLNLICLVFHGTGSLPSQRSRLYEEGL
ncbi:NACHT domain-containing protein [Nostoc sp. XA010]|uniref:NACHT domain-containing protein n=1 Tax=Nostoc sp. XA010 TaxID=2780407 RepID=UPI001E507036|nr:NACHT domain-containing protein [Nostoc sp. XA010]MCC5661070.1 NACHT domain-containing protein [Nostoc sp. XA010]